MYTRNITKFIQWKLIIPVLVIMLLPPLDLILYNTGCRVHGKTVSEKLMAHTLRPTLSHSSLYKLRFHALHASFLTLCRFNFVHFHLSFFSLRFLPQSLFLPHSLPLFPSTCHLFFLPTYIVNKWTT